MFVLKSILLTTLLSLVLGLTFGYLGTLHVTDHAHAIFPSWLVAAVLIYFVCFISGVITTILFKIKDIENLQRLLQVISIAGLIALVLVFVLF